MTSQAIPRNGRRYVRGRVLKNDATSRQTVDFRWASAHRETVAWRAPLKDWCAAQRDKIRAIRCGNALLDYVIAHPDSAPSPTQYCEQTWVPAVPFLTWFKKNRRSHEAVAQSAHDFFEWYLKERVFEKDEWQRPIPSSRHRNPVARPLLAAKAHETSRPLLPSKWVRMLLRILMEDDWKWARSIINDEIDCVDSRTGKMVRVWCPVRATALALMLLMPMRSFQVRMLDSGEGDATVFRKGKWVRNTSHLTLGESRRRQGFLRPYNDSSDGRTLTGFYVNTNKTSKTLPGTKDSGYEIPWEHPVVIAVASQLMDWQQRYNPVSRPLPWSKVSRNVLPMSSRNRVGSVFFLFRDPSNPVREEPLSYNVLHRLWCLLLAELETRLATAGQRRPDGSTISLVRSKPNGGLVPRFNLHCLRVSLLTTLARDGGVPLHILSKSVAGHSSIVMTLYYIKTNEGEIHDALTKAADEAASKEKEAFTSYMASESRDEKCFVTNDGAAADVLGHSDSALWKMMTTGLCPVGGTRCGDGGPSIGKNKHASVPGRYNCVHCRFHVSGPAFLPGLVARFNAASFAYAIADEERADAQALLNTLEERWYKADPDVTGVREHDVERAEVRLDDAVGRCEAAVRDLRATKHLIERCEKVARLPTEKLQMVLAGQTRDVKAVLETAPAVALWDAVCQAADIHPCVEVAQANEKRARALDRMLVRSGVPPVFVELDGAVMRRAANQMVRVLSTKLGREKAMNLIDGRIPEVGSDVARLIAETASAVRSHAPQLTLDGAV